MALFPNQGFLLDAAPDHQSHCYYLDRPSFGKLEPRYCGYERCAPGHSYGPAVRDHFYYHYIASGKGELSIGDTRLQIGAGCGFIIFPHQIASYQADTGDPWAYMWAAFSADNLEEYLGACGITRRYPVIRHQNPETVNELLNAINHCARSAGTPTLFQVTGLLHVLMGELCGEQDRLEARPSAQHSVRLLEKALYYIKTFYYQDISIRSVADYVGVDSSYLTRLFRRAFQATPVRFLREYRLDIAIGLLLNTKMAVGEISAAVGFNDPLYFSRCFVRYTGMTPTAYREKLREELA